MENLIHRYKEFVFGKDTTFDVQKKVFLLITHISIIIGIIGVLVDIALGLGFLLTLVTTLALSVLIFFHYKVRISHLKPAHSIGFFIVSVAIFSVLWFYNGGYDGNNGVLIFVYFTVFITILPAKYRIYGLVTYSFMVLTLVTVQFLRPDLIIAYEFEHQRYIDLALGYFLYLILAYSIQNTILKNYEEDRKKIKIQNDQLNVLIEKQNDTNEKLEQTLNHVKELNSAKDRFITILSHDLRSPFQGLLGVTKTLESDFDLFDDKEKKFFISQANTSLEKLYSFVEELLLWGRIQKDAVRLNFESVLIKELIIQQVSIFSELVGKKKITIEVLSDDLLSVVLDKEMVSIVLRNIISNAIKFSTVGGKILVNTQLDGNNLNISITDNGIGISEEIISKLFKLDENVSTKGTDGEQGSGMGLILCFDILKKHNGEIFVKSKEGKGTTLTLRIPQNSIQ